MPRYFCVEVVALPNYPAIVERFWANVDIRSDNDCWPWKRSVRGRGYGNFKVKDGWHYIASRFAIVTKTGERHGLLALHSCDNPICCNPAHLRWGTASDNMRDRSNRNLTYVAHNRAAMSLLGRRTQPILSAKRRLLNDSQEQAVLKLRAGGAPVPQIAEVFGLTVKQVYWDSIGPSGG